MNYSTYICLTKQKENIMETALNILTNKLGKEVAEMLILKYYQDAVSIGFKNADCARVIADWHEDDLADEKHK